MGDDFAVVSWDAQQSMKCDVVIGNYSVRYHRRSGNTSGYTTVYTSDTKVTLQELERGATYSVSVAAIDSNEEMGNYSVWVTFTIAVTSPAQGERGLLAAPAWHDIINMAACCCHVHRLHMRAGGEDVVGPAVGGVVVVLLIVAAVTVGIVIVLVLYRRK